MDICGKAKQNGISLYGAYVHLLLNYAVVYLTNKFLSFNNWKGTRVKQKRNDLCPHRRKEN